jgi:flagellar protein FliO/FliZ
MGMIWDAFTYLLLLAVLAGAGYVGYAFLRSHLNGEAGGGSMFGPKPVKRLDIVEQSPLDARRRLILIRRDDVEHLIMTGGPVDVIIETGIGAKKSVKSEPAPPASPPVDPGAAVVYSRPARTVPSSIEPLSPQPASAPSKAGASKSATGGD